MITTPNKNTTTPLPSTTPTPTINDLLTSTFEALDAQLDHLHNAIQSEGINPILAAKIAVFLDYTASEARGFTGLIGRKQRPPQQRNSNGNTGKPFRSQQTR